ncbi:hypothetical protein H0H92_002532, partial [Tricholoma furcatifolium]
ILLEEENAQLQQRIYDKKKAPQTTDDTEHGQHLTSDESRERLRIADIKSLWEPVIKEARDYWKAWRAQEKDEEKKR